ncbi:alpha/beta fold hydrolase [Micromonospora sp. NPDC085948]|uniref:thioesterase II family protein n=1 Tax=Micromonospora sp. NPDC085948 TaxID=3155293 RepID=UPI00341E8749
MSQTETTRWLHRLNSAGPDAALLVCLPHAGGSATFFRPLARAVSPLLDVVGVQYPGRQERRSEPLIDNIDDLAEQLAGVLTGWADRPMTLFGHSMGATIAFEVAGKLQHERAVTVTGLIASGRRAPSTHRDDETVHLRDDAGLLAELQALNGTHASLLADPELQQMILPVARNDYKAIEMYRYRPGAKLRCPITVLVGDSDPKVSLQEARAWAEHTDRPSDVRTFAGGHFYLTEQFAQVCAVITATVSEFSQTSAVR